MSHAYQFARMRRFAVEQIAELTESEYNAFLALGDDERPFNTPEMERVLEKVRGKRVAVKRNHNVFHHQRGDARLTVRLPPRAVAQFPVMAHSKTLQLSESVSNAKNDGIVFLPGQPEQEASFLPMEDKKPWATPLSPVIGQGRAIVNMLREQGVGILKAHRTQPVGDIPEALRHNFVRLSDE